MLVAALRSRRPFKERGSHVGTDVGSDDLGATRSGARRGLLGHFAAGRPPRRGRGPKSARSTTDFAALTPIDGFYQSNPTGTGAIGAQTDILATPFVAPRSMTCLAYAESTIFAGSPSSMTGFAEVEPIVSQNGTISYAFAPPRSTEVPAVYKFEVTPQWGATQTRPLSITSGATVSFGCRAYAFGNFTSATQMTCTVVYSCH
jgi:hypothetical protein